MRYDDIDEAWLATLRQLLERGRELADDSRDGPVCGELLDWHFTLDASRQRTLVCNPARALSPAYAAAETLWYLSGSARAEMLLAYAPTYERFVDDSVTKFTAGAYGAYLMHPVSRLVSDTSPLEDAVAMLRESPRSRQAVVSIWSRFHLHQALKRSVKGVPCTLDWQFMVRKDLLHMSVTMRSNDAWLGLPYDVFAFTCFQRIIASELGVGVGDYHHHARSMHLYARDEEGAKRCLDMVGPSRPSYFLDLPGHGWGGDDKLCNVQSALERERTFRILAKTGHHGDPSLGVVRSVRRPMLRDLAVTCGTRFYPELSERVHSERTRLCLRK